MKYKSSYHYEKILKMQPKNNESSWDYGMRVWNEGQRHPVGKNWEKNKVEWMYKVNKAKLEQHVDLKQELIGTNKSITHRGSGKFWDFYNPVILMRIREELKP
mmetsp:Transcript_24652/g.54486  ORF Transcript_24652/g.54486 Transcript_24652/m.54486 type:complete len:103 (+) Transcript_24652:126-434(+)